MLKIALMLFVIAYLSFAQTTIIKGKLLDVNNKP